MFGKNDKGQLNIAPKDLKYKLKQTAKRQTNLDIKEW